MLLSKQDLGKMALNTDDQPKCRDCRIKLRKQVHDSNRSTKPTTSSARVKSNKPMCERYKRYSPPEEVLTLSEQIARGKVAHPTFEARFPQGLFPKTNASKSSKTTNKTILACCKRVLKNLHESCSLPTYETPVEVACFSTELNDSSRESLSNGSSLEKKSGKSRKFFTDNRYNQRLCAYDRTNLSPIAVHYLSNRTDLDLQLYEGIRYDKIVKPDEKECMGLFLECLKKENLIGDSDFVCRRGLLTRICGIPYSLDDRFDCGMIVSIQKVGGTYYMQEFETAESYRSSSRISLGQMEMAYGGRRFEAVVTTGCESGAVEQRSFNDQFVSVRKTQFGDHSLIIQGEIDGCLPDNHSSYVEMKTTTEGRLIDSLKSMKWWLQSHLMGTDNILCGYRHNKSGIVHRTTWFRVDDFKHRLGWSPELCFMSLKAFLDFVKEHVINECMPYYLKRDRWSSTLTLSEDRRGNYKFLPLWLLEDNIQHGHQ